MRPNAELIKAAETVFLAMTYTESIRPSVEKIQQDLVDFWKMEVSPKWRDSRGLPEGNIIDTPNHVYLASDEDARLYYLDLDDAYKKAGYKDLKAGYCPLLIAESLQREAERLLVESSKYIHKMDADDVICSGMKNYKQLIELTLKLCAPFVSVENVMQGIKH
jgi:hypothetical protein